MRNRPSSRPSEYRADRDPDSRPVRSNPQNDDQQCDDRQLRDRDHAPAGQPPDDVAVPVHQHADEQPDGELHERLVVGAELIDELGSGDRA